MQKYVESIKRLFKNQSNVSVSSSEEDTVSVCIDYSDVGEEAGEWMRTSMSLIENNFPSLACTYYDCNEIVSIKFREKEEVRKQKFAHEVVRFTLEETSDGLELDFWFPLQEHGFDHYLENYLEKEDNLIYLEYFFVLGDTTPRLIVEGNWMKPTQEDYDSFEKRIQHTLHVLNEKIQSEINNIENWEAISGEEPFYQELLSRYEIQEEPYSEESEKKLANILK